MVEENRCCGCGACSNICPKDAIKMEYSIEGFKLPVIDKSKCMNCNLCDKVCPITHTEYILFNAPIKVYGVKHKSMEIRMQSRSGGIFTAVSDWILNNSGVVYGCRMENNWTAVHDRADTQEARDRFRGSKYIQSEMRDIYKKVESDLKAGKRVLFSGTSCQVAAMKEYCTIKRLTLDNLYLVDIVCHGVPSPLVWKRYLKWLSGGKLEKIKDIDFRNKKKYGWFSHVETIILDDKKIDSTIFAELFYSHNIVRKSCFECPYKQISHPGDLTIADYWNVDIAIPKINDNKGVSLVLVNSEKGMKLFTESAGNIYLYEGEMSKSMQPPFQGNYEMPISRCQFWNDYETLSSEELFRKYAPKAFREKTLQGKIEKQFKKLSIMSLRVLNKLKRTIKIG